MTGDRAALRAIVSGRVQGVGFRFFVEDAATSLGLTGYVRNLSNGNVEVVAEGPRHRLEALLRKLNDGPPLARVAGVTQSWEPPTDAYDVFSIR
jgi:acylphosphatase